MAYFIEKRYDTPGKKTIKISDNLRKISIVGDMADNPIQNQAVSVRFGDKVEEVGKKCLVNSLSVTDVFFGKNTQIVDASAFMGCKNLTGCDAFGTSPQVFLKIEDHAFAGTGLKNITLDLSGTVYDTGIEAYAFADCKDLKSVTMTRSSFLAEHAFDGCESLTDVKLPNRTSYVYNGVFANCASLESITFPSQIWSMGSEMFKGCTKLSNVTIEDSADSRSIMDYIGSSVFDGCPNLKSITLPASISSFTQIDPNFLKGSSVSSIRFFGIDDETFEQRSSTQTVSSGTYITAQAEFVKALSDAQKRNIPMVIITDKTQNSGCTICKALEQRVLNRQAWKDYVSQTSGMIYFVFADARTQYSFWKSISHYSDPRFFNSNSSGNYAKMSFYWKKSDGNEYFQRFSASQIKQTDKGGYCFSPELSAEQFFSGADVEIYKTYSDYVQDITKLGSPLDSVQMISKQGHFYTVTGDKKVDEYDIPEVNKDEVSDFKPGVWYYNAEQLKKFADQNHVPVFVEYSDIGGCTKCKTYESLVYDNKEFQEWVREQPYFFCTVAVTSMMEFSIIPSQPYFVRSQWSDGKTSIPAVIFYWNKENGTVLRNIKSLHSVPIDANYYLDLEKEIQENFQGYVPKQTEPLVGNTDYYEFPDDPPDDEEESGQFDTPED